MKNNLAVPLGLFLAIASCGGSGSNPTAGTQTGRLRLLATDAPFDHSIVEEARVTLDRITAHVTNDESGFVTLYEGAPFEVDLATLRNGITQLLASEDIPTGTYSQFRFRLTDAYLRLVNGNEYSVADGTIKLTSQATSGYKVFLDPGVEVEADTEEEVLLDFDLTKTFKPTPGNDPLTAQSYKLHPNVRAAVMSKSGEMRGNVTLDEIPISDAVVYVLEPGSDDVTASIAATATDSSGAAAILGLEPGMYDVMIVHGARQGIVYGVQVPVQGMGSFEFELD